MVLGLFGVGNAYLGRGGAPGGTLGLFGVGNAYLGRGGVQLLNTLLYKICLHRIITRVMVLHL